jgi:hypothetical protein
MRTLPLLLLASVALVTLALAPGCGYTTKQVFPEQVQSIYLPIFQNRSFYRGVEFDLTEALAKEIELRTPYKIAQQGAADSTLTGTIVSVDQTRLSRTRPGGLPQEMEVRVVVDLDWKDGRTGKIIRQRRGLTAAGRYIPVRKAGEQYQTGQHEAVDRMAQEIVAVMRGDW